MTLASLSRHSWAADIEEAKRIFPLTNEDGVNRTYMILGTAELDGDTLVGASCLELYNLATSCRTAINRIVVIDVSSGVKHFQEATIKILSESEGPDEALKRICALMRDNADIYFADGPERMKPDALASHYEGVLRRQTGDGVTFLSSPERFGKMKDLAIGGKIQVIQGSLTDGALCRRVSHQLLTEGHRIGLVYTTSIRDHLHKKAYDCLMSGLSELTSVSTVLVDAYRDPDNKKLYQQIFRRGTWGNVQKMMPCMDHRPISDSPGGRTTVTISPETRIEVETPPEVTDGKARVSVLEDLRKLLQDPKKREQIKKDIEKKRMRMIFSGIAKDLEPERTRKAMLESYGSTLARIIAESNGIEWPEEAAGGGEKE